MKTKKKRLVTILNIYDALFLGGMRKKDERPVRGRKKKNSVNYKIEKKKKQNKITLKREILEAYMTKAINIFSDI